MALVAQKMFRDPLSGKIVIQACEKRLNGLASVDTKQNPTYRNVRKINRGLYFDLTVFLCLCGLYFEAVYSPVLRQKHGFVSRFLQTNLMLNTWS